MHGSTPNAEVAGAACGIGSHALVEASLAEIAGLRDGAVPDGLPPLPSRFLRHCDEQTVVGMRAVLAAIAAFATPRPSFSDYGVVAAPCQAGRIATAQSLAMLRTAGGVAVSPHIVPQCSLHSVAGAVSVAIGMHGPNIGVSGGDRAVSEALLTGLSLLTAHDNTLSPLPGVWLVLTSWTKEPCLDAGGKPQAHAPVAGATDVGAADADSAVPICRALAVALTAAPSAAPGGLRLSIDMSSSSHQPARSPLRRARVGERRAAEEILDFARALGGGVGASWTHECPWGGAIRLDAQAIHRDRALRDAA